ncbi:MAG: TVP38/TMEM64 family protein [Oligoflexales bacterium]
MKSNKGKVVLTAIIALLVGAFFYFDLGSYFTLSSLKNNREAFQQFYQENTVVTLSSYVIIYVLVTALSLPGATIMTLAGGAFFGLWVGTALVSVASTTGATLAFLTARYLLRDVIQHKFSDKLEAVNRGIEKEGALYLFTLRVIPAFPFFVINLVMGLTSIRTVVFFAVSQVGMLPGTMVYVNAGTQLAQLESLSGILSPQLIGSFVLLGLFPLIAKKTIHLVRKV